MGFSVPTYNIECCYCQKPLINGVRRKPTGKGNYVAGYSAGYICEDCIVEIVRK